MQERYGRTVRAIEEERLIAILRGLTAEQCVRAAGALYDGGFRLLEVTFDGEEPEDRGAAAKKLLCLRRETRGRMMIGAGTVTDLEQLELAAEAGAEFIISPNVNEELIRRVRSLGLVSIPGGMTPTEIIAAQRAGADFVKLFPAAPLGAEYLKAIRVPAGSPRLLAVGGVETENLEDFLNAGALGAGIGGCLVNRKLVEAGAYAGITKKAAAFVELMRRRVGA
ncbi:MAG: bifunctional 4-hydroxy-2-oxoglutarate aldolase/2-dehydro-3-deoxy-phosphogluconate aldolase [Oscillibacter sp.]|nr:bifunctional 4-hydroxy-2-oxoglutarate aldolase/2-dehydro-3-deoxy-phosphogluconate aldolase [Oscillibacter sp.]